MAASCGCQRRLRRPRSRRRVCFARRALLPHHRTARARCYQGPPIGIDAPLVDREGFPRADIDVYRARALRKRFLEIQTDHKALEREMERGLIEVAALAKAGGGGQRAGGAADDDDEEELRRRRAPKPKPKFDPQTGQWVVPRWDGSVAGVDGGEARSFADLTATPGPAPAPAAAAGGGDDDGAATTPHAAAARQGNPQQPVSFHDAAPFAVVDEVFTGSPAHAAGLAEGDVVLNFGPVDAGNHRAFRSVAELLPRAAEEGAAIEVVVRRKTSALGGACEVIRTERVELRPRAWGGRGLLGCHIRPYTGDD